MIKKILALVLASIMAFSMMACGKKNKEKTEAIKTETAKIVEVKPEGKKAFRTEETQVIETSEDICGIYYAEVDMLGYLLKGMGEEADAYIDAENLFLTVTLTFKEDNSYTIVSDVEGFIDKTQSLAKNMMYNVFAARAEAEGKTVEAVLAEIGVESIEAVLEQNGLDDASVRAMFADEIQIMIEGTYSYADGVVTLDSSKEITTQNGSFTMKVGDFVLSFKKV